MLKYIITTMSLKNNKNKISLYSIIIVLFGSFLNHSDIIFSINMSFSDVFLGVLIMYLFFKKHLILDRNTVFFFLLLMIITIFVSSFLVPWKFNIDINIKSITRDGLKLLVLYMYFSVGFSLQKFGSETSIKYIKYFSLAGIMVGLMGIAISIMNLGFMRDVLFFGDSRYRGFMNDPNYFSVLMVSTLPYFFRISNILNYQKSFFLLVVFFSVLVSGSKTGIIVFLLYLFFLAIEYLFKKSDLTVRKIIMVIISLFLIFISMQYIDEFFNIITQAMPIFKRVSILFTDFDTAISDGGSGRYEAWYTAISIIRETPFLGIGVGTYSDVGIKLTGSKAIAHNTYLQLLVEWGLIMTSIFLLYLIKILTKVSFGKSTKHELVMRDIIIIILFGSMSISLNNMRLLWLCLGMLSLTLKKRKDVKILTEYD